MIPIERVKLIVDTYKILEKELASGNINKKDFVEKSKEYYAKASEMAGLREKISIHTNAYNAYISLMQTDNPNDSFIKFLKLKFLT